MRCRLGVNHRFIRLLQCLMLAASTVASSGPVVAQTRDLLTYGVTGDERALPERQRPSALLEDRRVQQALIEVAHAPRDADFLNAHLSSSQITPADLLSAHLLRREGQNYALDFALFTKEDVATLRTATDQFARSLAERYLAQRSEFDKLFAGLPEAHRRAAAYIVIGAFSLDWDALDLASHKKMAAISRDLPGRVVAWAEERGEFTLKGIYWGSHNEYMEEVVFTSFGDHFSLPRNSLPDLLWRMQGAAGRINADDRIKDTLGAIQRNHWQENAAALGRMMLALRDGPKDEAALIAAGGLSAARARTLLSLLRELDYVRASRDKYQAQAVVLGQQDDAAVTAARDLSRKVISAWLDGNYEKLRQRLVGTSPVRNGVPYPLIFTQVWHYIFGIANRQLVEGGFFADPYADDRRFKGFIPAVWRRSLAHFEP